MTAREESGQTFEMVGSDPSSWLHQAQLLKTSADLLYEQLRTTQHNRGELTPSQRSHELMAGMHSYMMLTGFCLENLVKGILISRNPSLVNQQRIDPSLLSHEAISLLPSDILLTDREKELLTRLQQYAIWSGRYPIPVRSHEFHQAQGKFKLYAADKAIVDNLFFRLSSYVVDDNFA